MKYKYFFSVIILLAISLTLKSQVGYEVTTEKKQMNGIDTAIFVLGVDRAIEKEVLKAWENIVEKNKAKAVVDGNVLRVSQGSILSVSKKPIDIYSLVKQDDAGVKIYSSFTIDSAWVSPNSEDKNTAAVKALLEGFGKKVYKDVLIRELSEKKSVLDKLTKERDKNIKEQDKLVKSVQKDSLIISNSESEIILLKEQLKVVNKSYSSKKTVIASTNYTDKDESKTAKNELKTLDKNRKSIEKEIQKNTDVILDAKVNIRDDLYQSTQLKEALTKLNENITIQKTTVKEATAAVNSH